MSRALALLLALCALVLPSIARAHARVDVRVLARASGAVEASARSRVGSPEFLQRDPEGYVDSVNVYAAMANDPVNNRDPTGRYKVRKHFRNSAGAIVATAIDFDDGSGGQRVAFEPYDPNSYSPRNLVNRMKAQNALYRAELQRAKARHIARVATADGAEAARGLAYVYGSGTLADQPGQIYDIADGLVSLSEGNTKRARAVGGPAASSWLVGSVMGVVATRATFPSGQSRRAPGTMNGELPTGDTIHHGPTYTAFGDDADVLQNMARSQGAGGKHDVIVHGTMPRGQNTAEFVVNGKLANPYQIAQGVLENPAYRAGQPVRLATCHGGCGLADELAQILRVDVEAQPNLVQLDPRTGQLVGSFFDAEP